MQQSCTHTGGFRYARFLSPKDRSIYYAAQCLTCYKAIKTSRHGGKLRIKHTDIPHGVTVHDASAGGES